MCGRAARGLHGNDWLDRSRAIGKVWTGRHKLAHEDAMGSKIWIALTWAAVMVAAPAGAQDIAAGEDVYRSVCKNCHGPTAKGMASFPKLTDQSEAYLIMRLDQYRAGEKVGANTALMRPVAMDLSDEDVANVAAYIASLSE